MPSLSSDAEQIVQAVASPLYFAAFTTTRDAGTGRFVPLHPWPHQRQLLALLTRHRRVAVLHADGTGTTAAALAYALWRALIKPGTTVRLAGTARGETLVRHARHLLYRLPRHLRPDAVTVETSHELAFSTGSRVVGFDPGHDVAVAIADGVNWQEIDAAPARQVVLLARPGSPAFDGFYKGGRYERLFVPFSARPGRTGSGVESEAEALGDATEGPPPAFREFVEWAWPLVSKDAFAPGLHVDAIGQHLQLVADGVVKKLLINCPIRHGKSLLTSVLYPVYRWLKDPALRVMSATYSQDLTLRDAGRSKALVEHPQFKERFGRRLALTEVTRQDFYHTTAGGYRFSTSVGARTSGFDADAIVADDIHDFATRRSQAERSKAIDYFETALSSRLVVTGRESIVLAGHRVHEDDVYRAVLDTHGADWTYLVLPAEADPAFTAAFPNRHWQDPRQPGELLWPAKFTADKLAEQKRQLRHDYAPVFNQKPVPPEGSLFQTAWFKTWGDAGGNYRLGDKLYPKREFNRVVTVDLAIGQRATSDWTVAQVWDMGFGQMVLVHQERQRVDGARVIPLLHALYQTYQPQFLAIESVAYQQAVIDQLRALNVPVKRMESVTDKESRSVPAQVRAEAGQVWVPPGKDFTADWLAEVGAFPLGRHDDQADALSMAGALAAKLAGGPREPGPDRPEPDAADALLQRLLWADTPFAD